MFKPYIFATYEKFCMLSDIFQKREGGKEYLHGISKGRFLDFILPRMDDGPLANACFRFYDKDQDGVISFEEYIRGYELISENYSHENYFEGKNLYFFVLFSHL